MKKGMVRSASRAEIFPRCHQAHTSSTTGSMTVEVLVNSASTKAPRESQ